MYFGIKITFSTFVDYVNKYSFKKPIGEWPMWGSNLLVLLFQSQNV